MPLAAALGGFLGGRRNGTNSASLESEATMESNTRPQIVVVGVDYSESSELALRQALELASSVRNAELHAVHVASSFPSTVGFERVAEPMPSEPMPRRTKGEIEQYLDRSLYDFTRGRDLSLPIPERVVAHLRFDSPAEQIAELARDLEAHLVIVGTHGRRGLSRMLLGSVAEGVVRLSPCPVLVVRPREVSPLPRIEPACEHCVRTRLATGGQRLWCKQHSERHGPRHTYHQGDRVASDGGMPLVYHG
jgi:nucleotide-binding universal stress UspA family protein